MQHSTKTKALVESALLVAFATVLSVLPVAQLPYGGSITVASMLPIVIISYRNGVGMGLGAGLVFGVIQQLLGLNNLTYFTTWQSIVAIILLDYLVAFAVTGLGGIFRRGLKSQPLALCAGALLVSVLRYACHVISGATVWAGLSIPTTAALAYSLIYNATYMVPEAVVLLLAAGYLGSVLDFRGEQLGRMVRSEKKTLRPAHIGGSLAGLLAVGAVAFDTVMIFSHMQDPESGEFAVAGLLAEPFAESFWLPVVIATAAAAVLAAISVLLLRPRR
ncbi:MAG: hypothetical protein E7663_03475 [Ruminococcaceae bacterium]|nr:hypothetical protein [Oscillospiraceae bacterium]